MLQRGKNQKKQSLHRVPQLDKKLLLQLYEYEVMHMLLGSSVSDPMWSKAVIRSNACSP